MSGNVLIAGGSGLIGSRLTRILLERGYEVAWLSRSRDAKTSFRVYHWDTETGTIEKGALSQAQYIINLAGANINGRWTDRRRKLIVDSRVNSTNLLFQALREEPGHDVRAYISASGTSYYGNTGEELVDEEMPPADDFLANCCRLWENAARQFETRGIRTASIRTGMVLSDKGGALPVLAAPVRAGVGAALGNGRQWVSWIHIDDICRLYLHALENEQVRGAYNGVAPQPVRNKELINGIAQAVHKPLWLPNVPAFALRLILGEMSSTVLYSSRVSASRIQDTSFRFSFPSLKGALQEIYQ